MAFGSGVCLAGGPVAAGSAPSTPSAFQTPLQVEVLDPAGPGPSVAEVTDGSLDPRFHPFRSHIKVPLNST